MAVQTQALQERDQLCNRITVSSDPAVHQAPGWGFDVVYFWCFSQLCEAVPMFYEYRNRIPEMIQSTDSNLKLRTPAGGLAP